MTKPMNENQGEYSRQFISDTPPDVRSSVYEYYDSNLFRYPLEGIYIYSFHEQKMLYAKGWGEVTGIPDDEISMLKIVELTAPSFKPFVFEMNDKALQFLHARNSKLTEYSFTIEIKLLLPNGNEVPVCARVGVNDVHDDGTLKSIMGRFQVDYKLRFGKIMRFATYGPERLAFEKMLNRELFSPFQLSDTELQIIELLAKGHSYESISEIIQVDYSAVACIIQSILDRFSLKSESALVSFAYDYLLL
jgi:DNA-binding CsgD family transcriptional regulator